MDGMQLLKPHYYDLTLRIIDTKLWLSLIKGFNFNFSSAIHPKWVPLLNQNPRKPTHRHFNSISTTLS